MVRRAQMMDAPTVQKLLEQLGYLLTLEETKRNLQMYLTDEEREVFVAQINGQIVGLLALDMAQTFHRVEKQMHIISLVVHEAHRGSGIGRNLLKEAEMLARKQKCWVIELTSSTRREQEATHRFYESLVLCLQNSSDNFGVKTAIIDDRNL